ncbi:PP2C family protein-serine/threonine phosphatase [Alkalihalobacterium bogoriense]|uniref:PP2C family protein-serine/threonine phosphatase n=1 Tax=Alkalihalobacterium bogoriense TaxID=246272 RepID=UPI00047DACC5|nr:SpoIIE family protein phosphatase [Alkalihalobacterium bogoriense]
MNLTIVSRIAIFTLPTFAVFYYGWILYFRFNEFWLVIGANTLHLIAPLLATVFLVIPFIQTKGRERLYYSLLFISCLFYAVGQAIWNYYEIIVGQYTPFPGLSDVFYFLQALLFFCAVLIKMKQNFTNSALAQYQFDILSFLIILFLFSFEYIFKPLFIEPYTFTEVFFYFSYFILDIGIVLALLVLNYYTEINKEIKVLIIGASILVISHIAYSIMLLETSYQTGNLIDPLFSIGLLLIGVSGLYRNTLSENRIYQQNRFFYTRMVFPIALILLLFIWYVLHQYNDHNFHFFDLGVIAIVLLTLCRIIISRIEVIRMLKSKIKELTIAKDIQEKSLPQPIHDDKIQISTFYDASEELSGDFYMWFKVDEDKYGFLVIDVMGHGVSSALITMSIQSVAREIVLREQTPTVVMEELSKYMYELFHSEDHMYYFTGIYILLNTKEKRMTYVNGGHPTGLWKEKDGNVVRLASTCPPIGLSAQSPVISEDISYSNPGRLVLCTDGLLEKLSSSHDVNELEEYVIAHENVELDDFKMKLVSKLQHGGNSDDDKCLVIIDVK